MTADRESSRARRYLLGQATEEERAAIEQAYFANGLALEQMDAAEEDLIEDYLAGRLESVERQRFERDYLALPHRRRRVEMFRSLMSTGRAASSVKRFRTMEWISMAAAALLVVMLGGWWIVRSRPAVSELGDQRAATPQVSAPTDVTPPATRIFSMSISPTTVRSAAGDSPPLVIPAATDVVRLHLEGDASQAPVQRARARVRTVAGTEVWRGPAEVSKHASVGTIAQIDVPVARLPVDDYVIELFETDAAGAERERSSYFLAVRAR